MARSQSLSNNHNKFRTEFADRYGYELDRAYIKKDEKKRTYIFFKAPDDWIPDACDTKFLVKDEDNRDVIKVRYYYGDKLPDIWYDQNGYLIDAEDRVRIDTDDYRPDESPDQKARRLKLQRERQRDLNKRPEAKAKRLEYARTVKRDREAYNEKRNGASTGQRVRRHREDSNRVAELMLKDDLGELTKEEELELSVLIKHS